MRQQNVAFGLVAVAVHHHIDGIALLQSHGAIGLSHLLDGNHSFELVPEIDDDFGRRDLDDVALQQLPFSGWS